MQQKRKLHINHRDNSSCFVLTSLAGDAVASLGLASLLMVAIMRESGQQMRNLLDRADFFAALRLCVLY